MDESEICPGIARDIERLKGRFPQLAAFSAATALHSADVIEYSYKVHDPPRSPGWRGGFPDPDADGIAFYFHLWDDRDPSAGGQVDTQPVMPFWYIGNRRVTFLILEGTSVAPVEQSLVDIFRKHGMTSGPRLVTLSNIPRSGEIRDVALRPFQPNGAAARLQPAGLGQLLDAATPIEASDPTIYDWQASPWLDGTFVARGITYRVMFFLGGRGRLDWPGSFGYLQVAPTIWNKIAGNNPPK